MLLVAMAVGTQLSQPQYQSVTFAVILSVTFVVIVLVIVAVMAVAAFSDAATSTGSCRIVQVWLNRM